MDKSYITAKNIFLTIFGILLLLIFARFFSLLSFPDSSIVLEKGETIKLQPEDSITQKFTANRDNLAKVEFLLRSPGIEFEKNDKLEMQLADENCQNPLRTGEMRESFLNSGNLYEFDFSEIKDSQGKTFCAIATFEPAKQSAKAIQFFTQDGTQLSIRPVYANDHVWQDLGELNQRISQYKPFFLKHFYLWTISILFIILSIVLVVVLILL